MPDYGKISILRHVRLWNAPMLFKLLVIVFLVSILASLGSALWFLIRGDQTNSKNLVKSLTIRISLSLILFFLLILAFSLGWVRPHGV